MSDDKPPSYTEAMAAITAGLRRQGIRTREITNADPVVDDYSNVLVLLPSRKGSGPHNPSFRTESPPAYTTAEEQITPTAPPEEDTRATGYSKHPPSCGYISNKHHKPPEHTSDEEIGKFNPPSHPTGPRPSAPPMYPGHAQSYPRYAPSVTSYPEESSASGNVPPSVSLKRSSSTEKIPIRDERFPSKLEEDLESEMEAFDPSLPGPVKLDKSEYELTNDSPSCSEIKWTPPPNATDFTGLVYAIQLDSHSRPILTRSPKCKSSFDVSSWIEIMDTARPSIRVFLSPTTLTIGPAKWKLSGLGSNLLKVRMRLRAVADGNCLPSCKRGPWTKPIIVLYKVETKGTGPHNPSIRTESPAAYTTAEEQTKPSAPPKVNTPAPPSCGYFSKTHHKPAEHTSDEEIGKFNPPSHPTGPRPSAPPMYPGHAQSYPRYAPSVTSYPVQSSASGNVPSSVSLKRSSSTEKIPIRVERFPCKSDEDLEIEMEAFDPSLPGPVKLDKSEYELTNDSPSCSEIKWTPPPNATDFSGLVYAIQLDSHSRPILTRSPKCKSSFDVSSWIEIMDTARPSIRVFLSPTTLTIGPAKWKLSGLGSNPLKVRMRLRAVADGNCLPSCKKGPWTKPIIVLYKVET